MYMGGDDYSFIHFVIDEGTFPWHEYWSQIGEISLPHLYSSHWPTETDCKIAIPISED